MRCKACDTDLNDFECTRKTTSGEYLDLCSWCYSYIKDDVFAEGNPLLYHEENTVEIDDEQT